ncbi:MAG: hypothetical protein EOP04_09145 [Proteobacteria bacterium]|nr:MAG: hypothetical protein EOP04_09145 [Pseudomonadota bacterium]
MKIPLISSVKSKPLTFSESIANELQNYAKYLTDSHKATHEISDIVSHLLHDDRRMSEVPNKNSSGSKKLNLRMPSIAWDNLDKTVERTGLKADEVIAEVCKGILRDKSFLGWKAKQLAEVKNQKPDQNADNTKAPRLPSAKAPGKKAKSSGERTAET